MKRLSKALLIPLVLVALTNDVITPAFGAFTPSLAAATTYGVLASTYINPVPGTTINGDVGFTTPPAIAPAGVHTNYGSAAPYASAGADQASALALINAQPCTHTFPSGSVDLATDTSHGPLGVYTPGVYCTAGYWPVSIGTAGITLDGASSFIFRTGPISTATNSVVHLTSGASACGVFWTPVEPYPSTLGQNSVFAGTYISSVYLNIANNVTWSGRALTFGGTVKTSIDDTITVPSCSIQEPSLLRVVKTVINGNGGTAVAADFNLHVRLAGTDVAGSPAVGVTSPGRDYWLTNGSTYVVSEDPNLNYTATFSGDCNSNGNVTLGATPKTCTVTNTQITTTTTCTTVMGGAGAVTTCVTSTITPTPSPSPTTTSGSPGSTPSPSPTTTSGSPGSTPSTTPSAGPSGTPGTPGGVGTPGTTEGTVFIPTFPDTGFSSLVHRAVHTAPIGMPSHLRIPSIGVDAVVERIGLTATKAVEVPKGHGHVGWYTLGARPGNRGTAVIDGHFARKTSGWAVFNDLYKLRKGDAVSIQDSNGNTINFVVQSSRVYDLNARPSEVYVSSSGSHLNLVTCAGVWINALHGFNKRLVVFTDLVG